MEGVSSINPDQDEDKVAAHIGLLRAAEERDEVRMISWLDRFPSLHEVFRVSLLTNTPTLLL